MMGMIWCVLLASVLRAVQGAVVGDSQCYGPLGCITISSDFYHKQHRPANMLPMTREQINAKFTLFTRSNLLQADVLSWSSTEQDIKLSHFQPTRPTKLITHGWIDNIDLTDWMIKMKDAYLAKDDCNVVLVDWKDGTLQSYVHAVANTRLVGAEIALFVNKLKNTTGADPRTFHAIGHSLGAHIMGYSGERINRLGRITGLDPAEPHFQKMPPSVRLDPTDGEFVDIIHTDSTAYSKSLYDFFGMGMEDPSGHVDFYPNGGQNMPGCNTLKRLFSVLTDGLTKGMRQIVSCNHQRALAYMLSSIINSDCVPLGLECSSYDAFLKGHCANCGADGSSCAPMGYHADAWRRFRNDTRVRKMYLVTNANKPFCAHQYYVAVHTGPDNGMVPSHGDIYLTLKGSKGNAKVRLNKKSMTFLRHAVYTFIAHTTTDIGRITGIDFLFDSGFLSRHRFPLDYVEVRPLAFNLVSPSRTKNEDLKFRSSTQEVTSGKQMTLHR
ncbi:pancreatic triacylglycerol lipase-like [Ornithodoros turicata]|uniref:pancreatic triacylglycerol lipase-like n=1 Tax=Ornithodoros turicata TaxID=34597 RepID=UPI0031394FD5